MISQDGFLEHVKRNFAFLIEEFGFHFFGHRTIGDNDSFEYRSDSVYVRILRTAPDFEPRFLFGRIGIEDAEGRESFDWIDVGELPCCRDWRWQRDNDQPFAGRVVELARLLRECGGAVLRGEDEAYAQIAKRRKELHEQHILEEHLGHIRSQAEAAWKEGDYEAVSRLYGGIPANLSRVEQGRLSYARKNMSQSGRTGQTGEPPEH